MRNLMILCVLCLKVTLGLPNGNSRGVGAFAYQDSTGNRYGGTYGLKDGAVVDKQGDFPPNFEPESFQDLDYFFPEYFRNFETLLQEAFSSNLDSQKLAIEAAHKAFDLTSNQAGYIPNFDRFPFFNIPAPDFSAQFPEMQNFHNQFGAYAGAAAGPGFSHQVASINPANPNMPNVNKYTRFDDNQPRDGNQFVSVSSSSFSSSVNDNGEVKNHRTAETVVNKNGKVTKYRVEN